MKPFIQLFFLVLLCNTNARALSLSFSQTDFSCRTTSVNANYDCNFTGSIFMTVEGGVTLEGGSNIFSVNNGSFNFSITIETDDSLSFNVSTVVFSSDMSCASMPNNSAAVVCSHDCIPPPNDQCTTADTLIVQQFLSSMDTFTTLNIGASGVVPSCSTVGFNDLWYCFTATSSDISINCGSFPGSFLRYSFYEGCSGNEMACGIMINGGADAAESGFMIDSTYLLQMQILSIATGDQEIALYNTTGGSTVPLEIIDVRAELIDHKEALVLLEAEDIYHVDNITLQRYETLDRILDLNVWNTSYESEKNMKLEYLDTDLFSNREYFYRFKMEDTNGSIEYTTTVSLQTKSNDNSIALFPNPAKDRVYIDGIDQDRPLALSIFNSAGQCMGKDLKLIDGSFDLSHLHKGIYVIQLAYQERIITTKLTKL